MIGRMRFAAGTVRPTHGQSEGRVAVAAATAGRRLVRRVAVGAVALVALVGSCRAGLAQGYTFAGQTTVGSTLQRNVPVTVTTAGTLNAIEVLTQGVAGLDYSEVSSTFNTGTSYAANTSGTVTVQFAPKYPGLRSGAVVLVDASGNVLGMTLLSGTGTGPLSVMSAGELTTVAGDLYNTGPTPNGMDATKNAINQPVGVAVDGAGNFYYSDSLNHAIRKVAPSGSYTTIVGVSGIAGYTGDGSSAPSAEVNTPTALALDGAGNLYFCDSGNNVVREILGATGTTVGKIVTVAGNGTAGYGGDGSAATAAMLRNPQGLALDLNGNLIIADTDNNVIREVSALNGTISTIAGVNAATPGLTGDGGPATAATLYSPNGLYTAADGSLYIADTFDQVVRRIDATSHTITTVAGNGTPNYTGNGGPAISATMNNPTSVVMDPAGNLLIADSQNNVVRKVIATTGTITTIAGNASFGDTGDGTDANSSVAEFTKLGQIALDPAGDLFVADEKDSLIRVVSATTGVLQFPAVKEQNASRTETQTIENDGNADLNFTSFSAGTNAQVDLSATTCSTVTALAQDAQCVIGAIFKPTMVGNPVTGTISVASDSPVTPSTVIVSGQSLSIFPTETDLTVTPNPAGLGAPVTLTAHVFNTGGTSNTVSLAQANAPNAPAAVTFYDTVNGTATQIGTPQEVTGSTPGQGTATLVYSGLALGSHSITAVYAGDAGDATSTSAPVTETIEQQTNLTLTANPGPTATVYQNITFTATVMPMNTGGTTPTGVVNFVIDGRPYQGNVSLSPSGVASVSDAVLGSGSHLIVATYTGDSANLGSSMSYTETVGVATATISLGASTNSTLVTQPVTFTATLTGVNGNTPSGNVVFTDTYNGAATPLGTMPVNPATSTAVLGPLSTLGVGNHSVTATYQGDGTNYGPSGPSNAATVAITQVPTTVSLTPTNSNGTAGGSTNYTVTVVANSATNGVVPLSGTISLTAGSSSPVTAALKPNTGTNPATATATITLKNGGPGNVLVTASYGGATDYASSNGSTALLLTQATTNIGLTPTTQTISATQTATINAAVVSVNGGIPTSTVTFTDTSSGTIYPSKTLNASGNASLSVSTLTVGTHTFVASYTGDPNDNPSGPSAPATVTVNIVQPKLTLTPSATQPLNGQAFSLKAAVATGLGSDTATGTVTFTDSVASDPPVTMPLTNGSAVFRSSTLTDGAHTFTVSYGGDPNNAPVSGTVTVTVLQTAKLVVTGSPAGPIAARQSVTFTATLTPLQQIPVSGTITFSSNGGVIGTGTLNGSEVATVTTTALPVGTDNITASFTSDGVTQSATSNIYPQVVNPDGVTLNVMASSNPATFGAPLTLTATGSGTNGPLTGNVQFNDTFGGVTSTIGTGTFSSGIAATTTTALQPGVHSVVAAYQGDANDAAVTSAPTTFSVKRQTNTVVTATPGTQVSLAPVTVTATVSNNTTTAYATGTVTFFDGTTQIGTGTLNGSGVATLTLQSLAVGTHSLTAQYAGDSLNLPSTTANPFTETVNLRQTTTDLSTTASSLSGGQQLTLISVVHTMGGPVVPTGNVVFYTGSAVLATQALDGNGVATVTVLLTTPTAALTAVYSGDTNYASSTSAVDNVTLSPAPDFNLVVNPSTISVVQDQHTTVSMTLSSVKSFTDTLQLGCVGLPTAATCTFAQGGKTITSVTLAAGGTQTVSLTIDTGNPLQAGAQAKLDRAARPGASGGADDSGGLRSKMVLACVLPGCFLLGLIGMRRKRFRSFGGLLLLLCLAGASAALSGCASLNINGTPTGTYTFRVTAVGQTGISQATSVTLTVTH